jgi:hypothetical protein
MKVTVMAIFMLLAITNCLFAEGSLCIENNPQADRKIVNLDSQEIKNLVIKDYTTFIFRKKTERLKGISGGDLLIAGACEEFPDGFIRKVISIREDGDRLIIETVEGTVADMLKARIADTGSAPLSQAGSDANK